MQVNKTLMRIKKEQRKSSAYATMLTAEKHRVAARTQTRDSN